MIVVSNATPLIALARIGRFELLRQLFGEIHIPTEVFHETVTRGRASGGARSEVSSAGWIRTLAVEIQGISDPALQSLDRGEAETILLAQQLQADWTLMDERKGRRRLSELGLRKAGTVGLLVMAKQAGLLPEVRPELEALHHRGFSLSPRVVQAILTAADE